MYADIARNKRDSWLLIIICTTLLVALGWVLGAAFESPEGGIILAALLATMLVLIGYFGGDKVALMTSGAKPIQKSDAPELYRLVENLAIGSGLATPAIYIIPDEAGNAFATGRDPAHAAIAVTTGLLKLLDKQELEGVLAHELSHIKNYDIRFMTLVVVMVGAILLLSDILLRGNLFGGRRQEGQGVVWIFLIGIVLALLSPLIAELIKLAISRKREYLADASAALLTRYPEGLAQALEKIATQDRPLQKANHATAHLFLANPFDPFVTKRFEHLFSTHPPIEKRIERLRHMDASL